MKIGLHLIVASLFIIAVSCNKDQLPSPVTHPDFITSKFAGTYTGQYYESDNGVDSTGVSKNDTTYTYTLKVEDAGQNQIIIQHGPIILPTVTVNDSNYFFFVAYNHNITGHFTNDSLYMSSKALNGAFYPAVPSYSDEWFVIQYLSFKGKRTL